MSWPRSVLEPVSFGGHDVPVGWTVIAVIGSANRDETRNTLVNKQWL